MSLAETVEAEAAKIAKRQELKILIYDIERMPGRAKVKHRGLTIEGDFWDLSGWKHTLGYRIHADYVLEWPRTICVAWRFLGDKDTQFASEWADGHRGMHKRIWDAFNTADITVGHNSKAFDEKHLNTGWRDLDMNPPLSPKPIDTLTVARSRFGDESKTLDALCRRIGITGKTDSYKVEMAREACAGLKSAQKQIKGYNIGDIDATEALYVKFLPWIKSHPHTAPNAGVDKNLCPRCASDRVRKAGTWTVHVHTYLRYACRDCGGQWKTTFVARGPSVKTL
jgi:hypothetical protein